MKTGKIVGLTVAAVFGLVLLVCVAMSSHMKKQVAIGHDIKPSGRQARPSCEQRHVITLC